jgi:Glucose-6-phosphate dehydrogenase, C-terminal domain
MAEAFDVADRAGSTTAPGAVRDVVQNHMLQVLATVTADPPGGGGLDTCGREVPRGGRPAAAGPGWLCPGSLRGL